MVFLQFTSSAFEQDLQQNLERERKKLESRQQEELNKAKQTLEREKEESQRKLR